MAHKGLKGRKKPSKKGVRQNLKQERAGKAKKEKGGKEEQGVKEAVAQAVPAAAAVAKRDKKEARLQAQLERQHRSLYSTSDRILLVGEGNFSFARALCRNLEQGSNVYATAYDTEATLKKKYPDAQEARKEIEEQFSGTTLVGVDATRLHKVHEFRGAFTKVIWNFPHIGGGQKDVEKSIAEHQKLLETFFASAVRCLDEEASMPAIHVALKAGEPYKSWKIVQLARAACPDLELRTAVTFVPGIWPGYAHRRTAGFHERFSKKDSEELAKGSKVYVFTKRKA
mmetsp:Transcript_74207/g.159036  ORF Transcript_74207/g.159036 Transcript_74207/m.159036 type:complete len:284 (+) Transcript_74207:56-907(+)